MAARRFLGVVLAAVAAGVVSSPGWADEKGDPREKAALAKCAEGFIEAFHRGDARAVAGCWTPDGDYTDQTGRHLKGREAIEKAFQTFFGENKGAKVRIEADSLNFLTPDVAVEDGTTFVIPPDGTPPSRARYTIVHVKKDGQWYLSNVRDMPYTPPSNREFLEALGWMVGDWSARNDRGEAEHLSVSWTPNQNFLTASFAASVKGVPVGGATHWIAWDPQNKRIRSWLFDATGGFGEGAWSKDGDGWVIKVKSVLQDGKDATATFHITRLDADSLRLQATDRTVDGKPAPDREFKLARLK